jgi:hypothetical protein
MVHATRTSQRRLPPLQTGRADFAHPAYPRVRRSKACVERDRLGRRAETLRLSPPPRRARPLQAFVGSRSVSGITLSGRAGHSQMRNEAESEESLSDLRSGSRRSVGRCACDAYHAVAG